MRIFIFAVATIVAAPWATDQAPAADRIPAFDIVRNCTAEVEPPAPKKLQAAPTTKQMRRMNWTNAGLNLARQTSRPASGRAALEARRAM
jgi:hypothetical protein